MLYTKTLFSYNDVMIQPAVLSQISSRSECNPYIKYDGEDKLPIFTAPMSTVVNDDNFELFNQNKIIPILPRNISIEKRIYFAKTGKWAAFSLNEFKDVFCVPEKELSNEHTRSSTPYRALIDIANGHMELLYRLVIKAKEIYGNYIEIMVGNIANPLTYDVCVNAGVDYVRASIGAGAGCITASNTAIYYSSASLLDELYKRKRYFETSIFEQCVRENKPEMYKETISRLPKIVADGGVRNYSDVIKALALGADFVMIGGLFSSFIESAGETFKIMPDGSHYYYQHLNKNTDYDAFLRTIDCPLYKEFYGMASKEGQIAINGKKTKTSEGIKKEILVTSTIPQWVDNMSSYLRSAMSYCNINDVKNFNPDNVICNVISTESKNSVNK